MLMGDAIVGFIDDRDSVTENSVKQKIAVINIR